jgi:hypothetical protein
MGDDEASTDRFGDQVLSLGDAALAVTERLA